MRLQQLRERALFLNVKKTIAVIDATFAVAKRKPAKKKQEGCAMKNQNNVKKIIRVFFFLFVCFSGFLFATAKVASITAMTFFTFDPSSRNSNKWYSIFIISDPILQVRYGTRTSFP